jgi:hypothetical protein
MTAELPWTGARAAVRSSALALIALACAGCNLNFTGIDGLGRAVRGSGVVLEEARTIRNVNGLLLDAPGTAYVTVADSEALVIVAEDNLLPYLRVRMESGRLRIEVDSLLRLQPTVPIRYHLSVRELGRIRAAGDGRIEAAGLRGDRLLVSSGGPGGVRLDDVRMNRLTVSVNGSGGVRAAGRVPLLEASLGASGPFDARELDTDDAVVTIAGSGSATVRVRHRLDAHLSGSGSVLYYGNPTVYESVTGAGEVRRLGS